MDVEGNGNQGRRGFDTSRPLRSFVEVVRDVLTKPAQFFAGLRESPEEQRSTWRPLTFAVVCLSIGTFLTALVEPLDPWAAQDEPNLLYGSFSQEAPGDPWLNAVANVSVIATLPIVFVLGLYLLAVVQHLFVFLFVRERSRFWATFLVVAYTSAIYLVNWVPVLGYLTGVYVIYITAVGLREMHGTTTLRALLAALVPLLLLLAWSGYYLLL